MENIKTHKGATQSKKHTWFLEGKLANYVICFYKHMTRFHTVLVYKCHINCDMLLLK